MAKVSVVIACKNEQSQMRRCLESVIWADEIVIVDDVSEDDTVAICREYTTNIILNDSGGSFHHNKNVGIENASGDWIFSIDADEIVSTELAISVRNAVNDSGMLGYFINRKNYFLGSWIKGCGWYPDYIIRLFRKGVTKWPLEIHDTPKIEDTEKTGYLQGSLIHLSYTSIQQYMNKFDKYTTKLACEESEKGVRISKLNYATLFIVKPLYWFFRKYIIWRGCLDGFRGLFICTASAMTIFMTYAKLWEKQLDKMTK